MSANGETWGIGPRPEVLCAEHQALAGHCPSRPLLSLALVPLTTARSFLLICLKDQYTATAILTTKVKIFPSTQLASRALLGYQLGVLDRKTIRNIQKAVSRIPPQQGFSDNLELPNGSLGIHISALPILVR